MSLDCGRETTRTGEDMQPPHKEARIQIQDLLAVHQCAARGGFNINSLEFRLIHLKLACKIGLYLFFIR
uniref:Uncharacterized protein n=1 Tax=Anguilla anguilla TaxID=7936 RepID=A0A0E9RT88_ANGAN